MNRTWIVFYFFFNKKTYLHNFILFDCHALDVVDYFDYESLNNENLNIENFDDKNINYKNITKRPQQ